VKRVLVLMAMIFLFTSSFAGADEFSPYLMGSWFLDDHFKDGDTPVITKDTQFTFLNPMNLGLPQANP